ncbi:MAG: iron-sulfur cluster insertion protein ErpA [Chloroflexi bacterium]|nr:iron-sulfur cluster insertion protein ErpA [Chloroflexota bacterium]
MIDLTPVAAEKLGDLFEEKGVPNYGLRVFVSGGGCSGLQYGMAFEEKAQDGDQVFEKEGVTVFIDPVSFPYLAGAKIDYVDNAMGGGFNIENPNAGSACGCGPSSGTQEGGDASCTTC